MVQRLFWSISILSDVVYIREVEIFTIDQVHLLSIICLVPLISFIMNKYYVRFVRIKNICNFVCWGNVSNFYSYIDLAASLVSVLLRILLHRLQ